MKESLMKVYFPAAGARYLSVMKTVPGPTQPPAQFVMGALFSRVERQEREADHFTLSSA